MEVARQRVGRVTGAEILLSVESCRRMPERSMGFALPRIWPRIWPPPTWGCAVCSGGSTTADLRRGGGAGTTGEGGPEESSPGGSEGKAFPFPFPLALASSAATSAARTSGLGGPSWPLPVLLLWKIWGSEPRVGTSQDCSSVLEDKLVLERVALISAPPMELASRGLSSFFAPAKTCACDVEALTSMCGLRDLFERLVLLRTSVTSLVTLKRPSVNTCDVLNYTLSPHPLSVCLSSSLTHFSLSCTLTLCCCHSLSSVSSLLGKVVKPWWDAYLFFCLAFRLMPIMWLSCL